MFIDTARSDTASEASLPSSASSSRSPPPSPTKRTPTAKQLAPPHGVDPASLVGATIVRIRRSSQHPTATLVMADGRTFQVRVDGYHPAHARIPRTLETNAALFEPGERPLQLTVTDCRRVALKDSAMAKGKDGRENKWSVEHAALAFRFEETEGWHCVWASMAEYEERGPCVYRTFDDVYLDEVSKGKKKRRLTVKA